MRDMKLLWLEEKEGHYRGRQMDGFSSNTYGTNSQPYYVFLDNQENILLKMPTIKTMVQLIYLKIG